MLLLGTLTALCLQFFAAANGQRKEQYAQLIAEEDAANVMERLATVAWDDLPKQAGEKFALSAAAQKALPEPRIEIKVDNVGDSPLARRVAVAVLWRTLAGGPERKVGIVAWRYKQP